MSQENTKRKKKKGPPKVRSYVRPTKVHTPRPKKKPKYPDKEIEEEFAEHVVEGWWGPQEQAG